MEYTLTDYTGKARDFINKTLETPEVSAGIEKLSDGAYGLFSASGNVLYGIFKIVKGTIIATAAVANPVIPLYDVPPNFKFQTVRKSKLTDTWEIVTSPEQG